MITQRFAVEFDRRTVGIAVRVPGGFMFYASDDRFNEMDGRLFSRARAIERQLKTVVKRHAHERQTLNVSPSAPGIPDVQPRPQVEVTHAGQILSVG